MYQIHNLRHVYSSSLKPIKPINSFTPHRHLFVAVGRHLEQNLSMLRLRQRHNTSTKQHFVAVPLAFICCNATTVDICAQVGSTLYFGFTTTPNAIEMQSAGPVSYFQLWGQSFGMTQGPIMSLAYLRERLILCGPGVSHTGILVCTKPE